MSREINYIGMDVHKEAVVIAVLNSSGKLVMESIVETKASVILQFIHGRRGSCMRLGKNRRGQPGSTICFCCRISLIYRPSATVYSSASAPSIHRWFLSSPCRRGAPYGRSSTVQE